MLQSSSDYRARGLMSPNARKNEFRRIIQELSGGKKYETMTEIHMMDGAADLGFRLYCAEVADLLAAKFGTTRQAVREALDAAISHKCVIDEDTIED